MTKTLLTAILLLPLATSSAFAHPVAQTAEAVLRANQEAMGDFPREGTLRVQYAAEVNRLKGTAIYTIDLASGMFVYDRSADPLSGADGFDGKTPWMREISGVSITQEGGDRLPVAVNEAYRNANLWWRADRGGAQVSYVGREKADTRQLDHLSVTPQRGSRFDAWFDADSHLLVRTAEPQMFFKTQELYDDYRRFAELGLELDPLDPFVNFTMGRTYWLEGDLETSLGWLERATDISPHYAQGIYARAWTEALSGRALDARQHVDLAMRLSPLDPLHYAMLATRAFTHMALNEDAQAAHWAERGARAPGAHVLIAMVASAAHMLTGDTARASFWAANVRERHDTLTREDFFRAFPMASDSTRARIDDALGRAGFR